MMDYDPATGRFLNRNANPDATNPYVPWSGDPTSILFGPLLLLGMVFGNKKKRGKLDQLIIVLIICVILFMSLSCVIIDMINSIINSVYLAFHPVPLPPSGDGGSGAGTDPGTTTDPTVPPVEDPDPPCDCTHGCVGDDEGGIGDEDGGEDGDDPPQPPTSTEEILLTYGVTLTGISGWSSAYKEYLLTAVKDVAERIAGEIGGSPETAFVSIYEGFSFDWDPSQVTGGAYGWTASDEIIYFGNMYGAEYRSVRLIVHELGHLFDRKVCGNRSPDGKCTNIHSDPSARLDLVNVWNTKFCDGDLCLCRPEWDDSKRNTFWGFAAGKDEWQFAYQDKWSSGEVWADMYLGWVYNTWDNDIYGFGAAKKEYMDSNVHDYLLELK
jgi:hypothetical protein